MTNRRKTLMLTLVFALAVGVVFVTERFGMDIKPHPHADRMRSARALAGYWFEEIGRLKAARGLTPPAEAGIEYAGLLGDEFTEMTTTMGSLSAKAAAANPDFAALIVRYLTDAGIDSTATVAVIQSASFPSLAVASLAALQTLGCDAVVISSLGASMYGANQPKVTWLDMEAWLRERAGLRFSSAHVTPGAENDRGEGLPDGGLEAMTEAARRTGYRITLPVSLDASIAQKLSLLSDRRVDLLINVGGNQTALGSCPHAVGIPNGYHGRFQPCSCPERGIIARLAERGVPFIHLLYIRDLAVSYGIGLEGSSSADTSGRLYQEREPRTGMVTAGLTIIALALAAVRWSQRGQMRLTPLP